MTVSYLFLTSLAGGVGALARWRCDLVLRRLLAALVGARDLGEPPVHPLLGIAAVNVIGCFLAGLGWGLVGGAVLPATVWSVLSTGFLGGFTTFSTAVLDVAHLAREGRRLAALALLVWVFVVAVAACGAGLLLPLAW